MSNKLLKISILLLLSINLYGATYYDIGKRYFYKGNYEAAIYYFKKAKSEYSNIEMLTLWADSEEALGRELYLIAAYERILNINPTNLNIALRLNNLYSTKELKSQIEKTSDNFDFKEFDISQRAYMSNFLFYDTDLSKLHTKFSTSLSSDDVEYVHILEDSTFSQQVLDKPQNKAHAKLKASLSYIKNLSEDGFFIKADLDLFIKAYKDSHNKYIASSISSVELGKKSAQTIFSIPLSYEYKEISEYYNYTISSVKPKLKVLINNQHIADFSLIYSSLNQLDRSMQVLNTDTIGFDAGLEYIFPKNNLKFSTSFMRYSAQDSDIDTHPMAFVEKDLFKIYTSNKFLFDESNLELSLEYNNINYGMNEAFSTEEKRIDNFIDIGATFSFAPSKNVNIFYKVNYLNNNTNYTPLNYDKLICTIGLEFNS